jgi:O-antigen ligase
MTEKHALRDRLGFSPEDNTFRGAVMLAVMLAVLPLLQALPSDMDRTAALAFCPVVGLLLFRTPTSTGKAERLDLWLLMFAGTLAVGAVIFSRQFAANLVLTCTWIWTIAVGISARRLAQSAPAIRLVLAGVAAGGFAGLLWSRLQPITEGIAFPLYGHARIFGLHMLVSAAAVLALLASTRTNRIFKCFGFIAGVILWSGLFWSGSRGPLVGIAAGVFIWFWFGDAGERRRLTAWVPVLVLTGILGSNLLGTQTDYLGWKRVVSSTVNANSIQGLSSDRNSIWGQTLKEISHSPWFGQGADSYRFIQPLPVGDQPHNFILQWVLAFGAPAALALIVLLGRRILRGLRGSSESPEHIAWKRAAAACLLAATVGGLFDGVFYHAVAFIPVALLAGLAGSQTLANENLHTNVSVIWRRASQATYIAASFIIAVHAWLFFNLLAPPPPSPRNSAALVLRVFPSATYGFWRWIDAWTPSMPAQERLEWLQWAQRHSPQPAVYYYKQAQLKIEQSDLLAAQSSLERAVATSNGNIRGQYAELLRLTESAITQRNSK